MKEGLVYVALGLLVGATIILLSTIGLLPVAIVLFGLSSFALGARVAMRFQQIWRR